MSKRLTDTNKYRKRFIRGLPGPYKLLWDFLYHECDHAGIWHVDLDLASFVLGVELKENDALKHFNNGQKRVVAFKEKWFLPGFVHFQYCKKDGTLVLNENNQVHNSVLSSLKRHKLLNYLNIEEAPKKPLRSPCQGTKDKDKDKDISLSLLKDKKTLIPYREIIEDFNVVFKTKYQHKTEAVRELIRARIKEGHTFEDFQKVHRNMKTEWESDSKMSKYLRPQTLYTGNFSSYLNRKIEVDESKRKEYEREIEEADKFIKQYTESGKQDQVERWKKTKAHYEQKLKKLEA
jgi:uncharacterized phage protein (TIGR02220 family)